MLLRLLAITVALLLFTSSNALSLDSSLHLARHQQIAARHPAVKRSVSARCKKRNDSSTAATSSTPPAGIAAPTAPPASSSSQAPPPSSSPSSRSGKVGLAWALGPDPAVLRNFITDKVSAIYTWGPDTSGLSDTDGLNFIPMLWGTDQLTQFKDLVVPGYANTVFGFNEPDLAAQSNLDPETAAQIWMANGNPLREKGYKTITPAVAFSVPWMEAFLKACTGCQWDGMAAHIYTTDPQKMIDYLTTLHNTFNMNLWVTEFACQSFTNDPQCDEAQVVAFMSAVTQWMDQTEWVAMYFAYGVMNNININPLNSLVNTDGSLTSLAKLYIGA